MSYNYGNDINLLQGGRMTTYVDHHLLAAQKCVDTSLELIEILPETDAVVKMRQLLEYQYDILDCLINHRHFGSDALDLIIQDCQTIIKHIHEPT